MSSGALCRGSGRQWQLSTSRIGGRLALASHPAAATYQLLLSASHVRRPADTLPLRPLLPQPSLSQPLCSLVSKRPLATAHPVVEMRSFVWRTAMLFSRGFFGESPRVQSLLLGVGAFMLAFDYIRYVRAAAAAVTAAARRL